jgi:hypothetical protein
MIVVRVSELSQLKLVPAFEPAIGKIVGKRQISQISRRIIFAAVDAVDRHVGKQWTMSFEHVRARGAGRWKLEFNPAICATVGGFCFRGTTEFSLVKSPCEEAKRVVEALTFRVVRIKY